MEMEINQERGQWIFDQLTTPRMDKWYGIWGTWIQILPLTFKCTIIGEYCGSYSDVLIYRCYCRLLS
ncbi:hypothetical protein SOVF_043710 isoform B [Spinacia oleracea]|nr:hypothetical protein SOVF_043710 isoform B [Spinacia oleracea]